MRLKVLHDIQEQNPQLMKFIKLQVLPVQVIDLPILILWVCALGRLGCIVFAF